MNYFLLKNCFCFCVLYYIRKIRIKLSLRQSEFSKRTLNSECVEHCNLQAHVISRKIEPDKKNLHACRNFVKNNHFTPAFVNLGKSLTRIFFLNSIPISRDLLSLHGFGLLQEKVE